MCEIIKHIKIAGVWRADDRRAQEEPLDVVTAVEFEREIDEFPGCKGRTRNIVATAVDAVGAVVLASVAEQHLQKRDAPPVGRPRVANASTAAAPEPALGRTTA